MMSPRTYFRWSASLGLVVVASLFLNEALADDVFTTQDVAHKESYELHFLGCKLEGDSTSTKRIGVFQLIWKADEPTKLLAVVSPDGKKVDPVTDFVVHIQPGTVPFEGIYHLPPGWLYVGRTGIEAPGTQWMPLQPGQVITFATGLTILEGGLHWFTPVRDARGDKARLLIETKAGQLASDDIMLPLLAATKK